MQGLAAPVGSMVAGPREFIEKVHRWRKMLGGGMRQAGVIAAPGEAFPSHIYQEAFHTEKQVPGAMGHPPGGPAVPRIITRRV